jgi:hypothetical protein
MAFGLVVFMGMCAIVIDMGYRYFRRSQAQTAADAAALAGAFWLSNPTYADSLAKWYAAKNGYDIGVSGVSVTTVTPVNGNASRYKVVVSRPEPLFFAGIFSRTSPRIGADATAEYISNADLNITGGGTYGVNGDVTLSLFGPEGRYSNGDPFSVTNLNNGQPNPAHQGFNGYDFAFNVPANYSSLFASGDSETLKNTVTLDIFDPDCFNAGGEPNATANTVDEYRRPNGEAGTSTHATTTKYSLFWDPGTPNDKSDDLAVGSPIEIGANSSYDMKWNRMFSWDKRNYTGTGRYRLNVLSTDGSSENGFNLRAGPPNDLDSRGSEEATWSSRYGSKAANPVITATGNLPMNFNVTGTVNVTLGYVPTEAKGGSLFINKFDTDVDAKSVTYRCTSLPNQTFAGTLSSDGTWKLDTIALPSTYTGGIWTANYQAGRGDTSVWSMTFQNFVPGTPGNIRLVE